MENQQATDGHRNAKQDGQSTAAPGNGHPVEDKDHSTKGPTPDEIVSASVEYTPPLDDDDFKRMSKDELLATCLKLHDTLQAQTRAISSLAAGLNAIKADRIRKGGLEDRVAELSGAMGRQNAEYKAAVELVAKHKAEMDEAEARHNNEMEAMRQLLRAALEDRSTEISRLDDSDDEPEVGMHG